MTEDREVSMYPLDPLEWMRRSLGKDGLYRVAAFRVAMSHSVGKDKPYRAKVVIIVADQGVSV